MIEEYFDSIKTLLRNTPLAQPPNVNYDRRDKETGFLRGDLVLKTDPVYIFVSLFVFNVDIPRIVTCTLFSICMPMVRWFFVTMMQTTFPNCDPLRITNTLEKMM